MGEAKREFSILLVDDNPTNLTLLAKIIELDLPQVRVLTASDGLAALALIEQEPVDGAFIDVQMPEMSGLEVCRRIKAEPRTANMPLVLITAHRAAPELRAEGLEVGAYDFISQPISNVEMLARIKVMLRLCESEENRQDEIQSGSEPSLHLRWLSGLLLSGQGQLEPAEQQLLAQLAQEYPAAEELDEQCLARQLVEGFPLPWRRTFAKLSLLDELPLSLAVKLSEVKDIEAVFDHLQRHNLILTRVAESNEIVAFKPAVREQLRNAAGRLLDDLTGPLYQQAADWYQQRNDPLKTLDYLLRGRQFPAISQLLSQLGLKLTRDCYRPRLEQLLTEVPEAESVRCGWLALYTGVACLRSRPHDVDSWLELARQRFCAADDQYGEMLVLSQQLLQYLLADAQLELGPARLSRLHELAAVSLAELDPTNRLIVQFSQALGELFFSGALPACEAILSDAMADAIREKQLELQAYLLLLQVLLGISQGRFRVARAALEQASEVTTRLPKGCFPAAVLQMVASEVLYACGELAGFARQRYLVRQHWGSENFQQTALGPVLNFYAALGDLAQGNPGAAEELLKVTLLESPNALRPHVQSWLLQLRGFIHAQTGRGQAAREDCAAALDLRERVPIAIHRLPNRLLAGATWLVLADSQAAIDQLKAGLENSVALGEERYRAGFHAWLAAAYLADRQESLALQQLDSLFAVLRRQQNNFFFALTPELLRRLAPLVSVERDWAEQAQRLFVRWLNCRVSPAGEPLPMARLQVLGGYQLHLNGRCCDLSEVGQSSRQLLAVLAVAPNYSMSSELLMGALWPDSSPSKARNSFDTALSRLRKVLEGHFGKLIRQHYLVLEKGMLLLRNLQVDAHRYLQLVEKSRLLLQRQNFWQAELLLWQAEQLWQGEFLAGYELDAELPYRREQFNQLRLEQLTGLARLLQNRGENKQAIQLLTAGLQTEPTHDGLVQQLLAIYQQQGEKRAARQLLDSYRSALRNEDYDEEEIVDLMTALSATPLEA